jgi:LPXTG-motif cell wall-anchored protein
MSRSPLARVATTSGLTLGLAAVGLLLAPAALAAPSGPVVTPGTIQPGDTYTIAGGGCVTTDVANPVVGAFGGIGYGEMGDGADATPDAQGNWSVQMTFPADYPAGTYPIVAGCEYYNGDVDRKDGQLVVAAAAAASKATVTKASNGVVTVEAAPGQSLTPDAAAAPGEVRMLKLTGYTPGEKVTLVLHSTPKTIGTFTADAHGVVNAKFIVPAGTPAGNHTLKVTRADGSVVSYPVTVAAAGKRLADTGADVTGLLVGGAALVLGGAGALVIARRRTAGAAQV